MNDLLKILAAATAGLAVFIIVNAFVPHLAITGLGALNLAIQFAVVFLAGTIALRLGRLVNRRLDTSLKPRTFVLALGGATLIWLGYASLVGHATAGTIIVAVIADVLAVLAIWWQSGSAD
ncbi:hypothetical protein [Dongia sp.]|uniref:hypothetical protein n=1 Tax=Dongia sp. TaxID=1977262 RepID=UPI003750971D